MHFTNYEIGMSAPPGGIYALTCDGVYTYSLIVVHYWSWTTTASLHYGSAGYLQHLRNSCLDVLPSCLLLCG
jgi:hypothetical protein